VRVNEMIRMSRFLSNSKHRSFTHRRKLLDVWYRRERRESVMRARCSDDDNIKIMYVREFFLFVHRNEGGRGKGINLLVHNLKEGKVERQRKENK